MDNVQRILSGSFFFQMTVCAAFIAIVLSSIDENVRQITFEMVINIFCLLLELQLNFFSCAYATSVTTHANEIGEIVYNSEWYRLSIEQQKMAQFIIYRTEEPFYMKGYKIFTCSMETFQAVNSSHRLWYANTVIVYNFNWYFFVWVFFRFSIASTNIFLVLFIA